jgi:uncharacterized protein YbjT (DUF2867 family)
MSASMNRPKILLTGATGYVGGRLLTVLANRDADIVCVARDPQRLEHRVNDRVSVVGGDVLDASSLEGWFQGVDTAYYLVHSMGTGADFEELDRRAAENFGRAAAAAGVKRIVYLGGLGSGDDLSPHLRSRHETGRVLRESGVEVVEFRASIVIGSGSLSFEMVRALVEKLPVMITPRWVSQRAQPIAIEDLIEYLVAALDLPAGEGGIFEIGGSDRVSYRDLMTEYARQRSLNRRMISVPVITPRLSSLWLGLVTPVYARVGRKLLDGVRNPTVVEDDRALDVFDIQPRSMSEAIARALRNEDEACAETRWSDAISSSGRPLARPDAPGGSRIIDSRSIHVPVRPDLAFSPIQRVGGEAGWFYGDALWRIRGFVDLLFGGVGMRRGRRHPTRVVPGDALDFWRVEAFEPDRLLRLRAEMKLPGRAWLQFEVDAEGEGARIRQTAIFDPVGVAGRLYWYGLLPVHALIFGGMLGSIGHRARALGAAPSTSGTVSSEILA